MLIAYDGTERAGRALEYAAQLLRPTTVEILTAWEPVARQTARAVSRTGMHQSTVSPDGVEEDPAYEEALKICRQGIELAESLGLAGRWGSPFQQLRNAPDSHRSLRLAEFMTSPQRHKSC